MNNVLDVVPLRSFVAVAECGGYHRAAKALHVSQPTISQHIRKLEAVTGHTLMERDGRYSRITQIGEVLLVHARRMLSAHDDMLRRVGVDTDDDLIVGSTEHAADQLLPELSAALRDSQSRDSQSIGHIRFRLDRGAQLRQALDRGDIDLALLLGSAEDTRSAAAGTLSLQWFSAPGWSRPGNGQPLPLVAFDDPCAIRRRAIDTLADTGILATVVCDSAYLGGVLAAARAGLGVALLATVGRTPEGLVKRHDLPLPPPMPLIVRSRQGLRPELSQRAAEAVRQVLETTSAGSRDAR